MANRTYTEQERANALAALAANGGNIYLTARQLGIPRKTLERWAAGTSPAPEVATVRHQKKELADRLEEVAHQLVDSVAGKIAAASLHQIAVAVGIAVDKMRLLRGEATSIAGNELTPEQRVARIKQLLELVQSRRAAGVNGAHGPPDVGADAGPAGGGV